ncbi:hypothetical protein N7457_004554 [Penicillium paradoxum]|uniref:uncharacterized protein n=1 Tax=Penicillium paradoxum TaxID=176176 RepID=UPI002548BC46|nr:uncharacterized protein N7457_004554 [Penicillium paradoxum]KAJ5782780.1 hypothetical protein N7457_004554 [Penicillium paradoxum]
MAGSSYNPADLNSILSTLSSLSSQPQGSSNPHSVRTTVPQNTTPVQSTRSEDPRPQRPSTRPSGPSTPGVDPSTITTWPGALRYVMRTVGQNEETQARIRGMIRSQHSHEKQWFQGREALLKQQQSRPQKQRELDAVLRSIGAPVKEDDGSTEKEFAAEIAVYDGKVHRAATQMTNALIAELRGLGIPFFTLRKDLIQDTSSAPENSDPRRLSDIGPSVSSPISKTELVKLQRRMLELLEDLCKE